MYVVTNLGALRYLFLGERRRVPFWEVVFPLGGIGFAVYTLYKNLWPVPPYPFNVFPYIVAGWLVVGAAATLLVPGLADRIEAQLHARTGGREKEVEPPAGAASGLAV
jgi:hypothetical protein